MFAVLLVLASLFLSVRIDGFTLARRHARGNRQILNRAGPRWRLVKFALGGAMIPLAAFVAATRVELPGHRTLLALALEARLFRPAASLAGRIGDAVLRGGDQASRASGIEALATMGTPEALDQLLRIMDGDPDATRGGVESQALVKALAAFGEQARPKLLDRLDRLPAARRRAAGEPAGDLYGRHAAATFEALKAEIVRSTADPAVRASRLARLEGERADLQALLAEVETAPLPPQDGDPVPAFIMDALLAMNLRQDDALLAFARATAADSGWSDAVRGRAMLLVAKLGGQDDVERLAAYLDGSSASLRARALRAIADLEARLTAAPPG